MMDARIVAAAKLLDTENPGWAGKIDITKINMISGDNCILGQLYGHYVNAPDSIRYDGGTYRWAFHTKAPERDWIEAIKMRTEVKHLSSELLAIKTFDEFVAWRDKVTDREITVTIKASDARAWVDGWGIRGPSVPINRKIYDTLKTALGVLSAT